MNHPQDEEALIELLLGLGSVRGLKYYPDLLTETRRVGALRSEPYAPRGQVVDYIEEPIYELIDTRFALDAIWDGEESMKRGATEKNRLLVKKLEPQLDGDAKVAKARRSLRIPPNGFKDLEAAYQWAQPRLANWSRCDDACRQKLVWWESFTWEPQWETVMGRGYIMLNTPRMHKVLKRLVDEYADLGRAWYRALPFYLVRGRLEPPPRIVHQPLRKREKHEQICELWKKYRHDFKVVLSYNCGLTDADWKEIAQKEPAATSNRIPRLARENIERVAYEIAERKGTLRDIEECLKVAHVRKVRQRMREIGKM